MPDQWTRNVAEAAINEFLSQFNEDEQEHVIRYALDHVVPKLKSQAALTRQPAPEEAQPAQAVATTPVAWLDPAYPRYVMCSEHEIPGWSPLYIAAPPATSEDRDTLVMLLKDAEARADFLMDYLERHGLLVAKFCKPPNAPTEDWWVLGEPHMVKGDACEGYGKTPESAIRAAMAASSATEQGGGE